MYTVDRKISFVAPADNGEHTVRLLARLDDGPLDEAEPYFVERLEHLARVGRSAGFGGAWSDAAPPSVQVRDLPRGPAHTLAWEIHTLGIETGFWRALLGLLVVADATFSCHSIVLQPVPKHGVDPRATLTAQQVIAADACALQEPLPFRLDRRQPARPDLERVVRIRFAADLGESPAAEVIACLRSWNEILWGAFPEDGKSPLECGSDALDVYLLGPRTVEDPLPNFIASEAAFDVVVAMALWFHRMRAAVDAVSIE